MTSTPQELLRHWLDRQLSASALQWFHEQLAALAEANSDRALTIALGMAPRRLGRDDLDVSEDDRAAANAARPGWDPRAWSIDAAARVLCLLTVKADGFAARLTDLCRTADVAEAVVMGAMRRLLAGFSVVLLEWDHFIEEHDLNFPEKA